MVDAEFAYRIAEAAKSRYLAGEPRESDEILLMMAHHEDRCDARHAELLDLHGGNGASKKQLAGIGAACAAAAAGAVEGLRRALGAS